MGQSTYRIRLLAISTITLAITAGCGSSGGKASSSEVLDPTQAHYGATDDVWGARWWQWIYELHETDPNNCIIPFEDPTGENCSYGQDAMTTWSTAVDPHVFYLAGTTAGTVVRDKCVVPLGKAIFFPVLSYTGDNAGASADMVIPDGMLMGMVQSELDGVPVSGLTADFDGVSITNLARFKTQLTKFSYTLPPEPNVYDCQGQTGVTGSVDPAYAAGYYIMLAPPTAGAHTLHFAGNSPATSPAIMVDVTYHLTIK